MRRKVLVLAVVWLASLRGWSQTDAEEARILALENAWNQAVLQRDPIALGMLLGSELVYVESDGKLMNKTEYLASVQSQSSHPARIASEAMNVHFYGATAVVSGVYRETGVRNGKPYLLREHFIDTWVHRDETWMCVASGSTLIGQ
ncbi:MAG: nuclear transport factor 2 family protein [Candidatus Sulfotelmatobacter sp.]